MKTVKKEIEIGHLDTEARYSCSGMNSFKYTFETSFLIPFSEEYTLTFDVEEPETLKEFLEENNIPKKELIQWLNKNYK